ncbi:hypothetical protein TNCV_3741561 [Trichonephila clavipes]|nr:hypothetical protein TNCV_3741561 [Trichonephila clavipes]
MGKKLRALGGPDPLVCATGSRSYVECSHFPDTQQLDRKYLFSCPSIVGALFKIDNDCSMDILQSDRALDIVTAVNHAFGNI